MARVAALLVALLLALPGLAQLNPPPPAAVWDLHVVAVGTSPTRLDRSPVHQFVAVKNNGPARLFVVFDASGTAATGWPVEPGGELSMRIGPGTPVYGVVASGTLNVPVMEAD